MSEPQTYYCPDCRTRYRFGNFCNCTRTTLTATEVIKQRDQFITEMTKALQMTEVQQAELPQPTEDQVTRGVEAWHRIKYTYQSPAELVIKIWQAMVG